MYVIARNHTTQRLLSIDFTLELSQIRLCLVSKEKGISCEVKTTGTFVVQIARTPYCYLIISNFSENHFIKD